MLYPLSYEGGGWRIPGRKLGERGVILRRDWRRGARSCLAYGVVVSDGAFGRSVGVEAEALRGEGAHLVDGVFEEFVAGIDAADESTL